MTLTELVELLDIELTIHYRNLPPIACDERWYADLDYTEIKDGPVLEGVMGNGHTPSAALNALTHCLRGKRIVIHAMDPAKRREFNVPATLTVL
jgi:hypothetical protein